METIDPTQAPEAQFKYIERNLDVPLNDGEIFEASKKLANANQEKLSVEREKSEVNQGYNRRIRELNKVIERYSSQIACGFEERVVRCKVQFNYPSEGEKTITRCDNDAVIAVLSMDQDELQEVLPFDQAGAEADQAAAEDEAAASLAEEDEAYIDEQQDAEDAEGLAASAAAEAEANAQAEHEEAAAS